MQVVAVKRQKVKMQPVRTCLGCHKRFAKNELLKFVADNGALILDSNGSGRGRSAYCCKNKKCFADFISQKKKLSKALRVEDVQIRFELKDWE